MNREKIAAELVKLAKELTAGLIPLLPDRGAR